MKCKPMIWSIMTSRMKKGIQDVVPGEDAAGLIKKARPIYQELLSKVEGISDDNPMAGNITMSFVIIAVWLASDRRITPEQMSRIMENVLDWKPVKLMYGGVDMNTEKGIKATSQKLHHCADWAAAHPEDTGTWDFHFDESLHEDGFYYYFTHCPIADFCKKYGYEEINPVLCNIDYKTIAMRHAVLHREHTVAEGGSVCDYWMVGDRVGNPK